MGRKIKMTEMHISLCVIARKVRVVAACRITEKNRIVLSTVQQLYSLNMRCYRLSATAN